MKQANKDLTLGSVFVRLFLGILLSMRCLVVFNLLTEVVDFFWWCSSTSEYVEMWERLLKTFPASDYEISTEYGNGSSNYSHAAGYSN